MGTAHSESSARRVDDYILVGHLLDFTAGEAEGPMGCVQNDLG